MKFNLEDYIQVKMSRFLDGPETFQLNALKGGPMRKYRSSSIALFAWTIGIMRLFLSPIGFCLLPAAIILIGYATVAMDAPMRVIVLVILAVGAIELLIGFLFRPRIDLVRLMPDRVRAKSTFKVGFALRNRRKVPAWNLRADPFNYGPGLRIDKPAACPELAARDGVRLESVVFAKRRGRYLIYRTRIESHFPFNLVKWSCSPRGAGRVLSVYPAFTSLSRFTLPMGARNQVEGMARYSKVGESMELMGVRDYRDGDDIRHIDWPGTARLGTFVVKEFEEDELKRIALITDTHIIPAKFWSLKGRPQESNLLEAALELTAAVAEFLSRGEAAVELFVAGPEMHRLETGRGTATFDAVCDILSGVEPSPEPVLPKLAPDVFRNLSEVGGAVVILIGDDKERRDVIEKLRESGLAMRVLLITEKPPADMPHDWFALTPKAIRTGRVKEL